MSKKTIACRTCGHEIAKNAKTCPHCGAKNTNPVVLVCIAIVVVMFVHLIVSTTGTNNDTSNGSITNTDQVTTNNKVSTNEKINVFAGDCGISATAEMGTGIFGQPEVSISITNTTAKDISAIKFYTVPFDVYGKEIKGIFAENYLSTDDTISAGESATRSWQFLDSDVKTIKLYVYSVFFSDGTEWGDREATRSVILKNALEITVNGTSGK